MVEHGEGKSSHVVREDVPPALEDREGSGREEKMHSGAGGGPDEDTGVSPGLPDDIGDVGENIGTHVGIVMPSP